MKQAVNPLELPEILHIVGHYLLCWDGRSSYIYKNVPRRNNILSAMRVSRVWNEVLTPLCWITFNYAEFYRSNRDNIAKMHELMPLVSHHLRYLVFRSDLVQQHAIRSTQIQELCVYLRANENDWSQVVKPLLLSNQQQLSNLSLELERGVSTVDWLTLNTLSKLKVIVLESLTFPKHAEPMMKFLHNNASLEDLSIIAPKNMGSFAGFAPLTGVKKLTISRLSPVFDAELRELIGLCPNLETLKMVYSGGGCDMGWSIGLKARCPKIRSFEMAIPMSEEEQLSDTAVARFLTEEFSDQQLVHLSLGQYTPIIHEAVFVKASQSLETLVLTIQGNFIFAAEGTTKILTSCGGSWPNLRSLTIARKLSFSNRLLRHALYGIDWFKDMTWQCPTLESITYQRLYWGAVPGVPVTKSPRKTELGHTEEEFEIHWRHRVQPGWGDEESENRAIAGRLLCEKVWDLPKLRVACLDEHEYTRRR
ncbi:hypothetical protein BG004_007739 [Podila humilis]|nr:hypothetical protein BG004_007739 [Podila humilis]